MKNYTLNYFVGVLRKTLKTLELVGGNGYLKMPKNKKLRFVFVFLFMVGMMLVSIFYFSVRDYVLNYILDYILDIFNL